MNSPSFAQYLWLDGAQNTQQLRVKCRVLQLPDNPQIEDFADWYFDGAMTGQAMADGQCCVLKPVRLYRDPFCGSGHFIVLCEVRDRAGNSHESNYRARLRAMIKATDKELDPTIGFEQRYSIASADSDTVLNVLDDSYCAVGNEQVFGRYVAESHVRACLDAGIPVCGMHPGTRAGTWHFELGYPASKDNLCGPLRMADDLWVARYLLLRYGELTGNLISLSQSDGANEDIGFPFESHFSTIYTRDSRCSRSAIQAILDRLKTFSSDVVSIAALPESREEHRFIKVSHASVTADPYRICLYLMQAIPGQCDEVCNSSVTQRVCIGRESQELAN